MNLFSLFDMPLLDPSSSGPSSPAPVTAPSPLSTLPDDIFRCIADYLDRDAAWSLKRVSKGMAESKTVIQLLYRYPIQINEVRDMRLGDWKYRNCGQLRWKSFMASINNSTRTHVHKLAMSHWASLEDFCWIESNLPSLVSLDLSAIKDFVWTPEQTWTWKELAEACPALFARLTELEVANWTDYTAHSRIEYSYSYNDYRFKQRFRMSRRRDKDGGSIAKMIFPLCKNVKTLAIRDRYSGYHTWSEWEVHQRVCCLIDGVERYCSPTMSHLKVHDYAPFRSLFSTDATKWPRLQKLDVGLHSWMEERHSHEIIGPIPYRITQGRRGRDDEEAFDDQSFDTCQREHVPLGTRVVQGFGTSLEGLLQCLQETTMSYPHILIRPIQTQEQATLHPFHLVDSPHHRRQLFPSLYPAGNSNALPATDTLLKTEVQEALNWLAQTCNWRPILSWDLMMCDVFPANLESRRNQISKEDIMTRITTLVTTLHNLKIPIRISIGDRTTGCPSSGLDGNLYFGDFKTLVGEGSERHELLLPTQAAFNLTPIAHMIDELTISYSTDVPGVKSNWQRGTKQLSPAEQLLMKREMVGWRRFWFRYGPQLKNLKKLTTNVPNDIYEDWAQTKLIDLLSDKRWDMLEIEEKSSDSGLFASYFPWRCNSSRARDRRFVQRVFFRLDDSPLQLTLPHTEWSEAQREEAVVPEEEISDRTAPVHQFWPSKTDETNKKRKQPDDSDAGQSQSDTSKERVKRHKRNLQNEADRIMRDVWREIL